MAYGTDTSWGSHLIRWDNGVPTDLGTPPGSLDEINEQGDIVGGSDSESEDGSYHYSAWRYSNGQVTSLPGLPDSVDVTADSIAGDGTVAGWVRSADRHLTAVTWAPDNTVHPLPGTGDSRAVDIDTDGTVIGYLGGAAVRWAPGAPAEVLPGYEPGAGTYLQVTAISAGTVVGEEYDGTSSRVVVWAPGADPVSLGTGVARAVGARGSVVYKRIYENQLWLRQDGVDRALPFGTAPFASADVVALTDDDTAYGYFYPNPVRWVCA
jgi:uncharacterized membrane protein